MISAARSFSLLVAAATFTALVADPARAQTVPVSPASPVSRAPLGLGGSLVVGGDWLQANALPLNRDAVQSMSVSGSYRLQHWAIDGGWMRIARDLSTVQGGFLMGGPLLRWHGVLLMPEVGGLVGKGERSVDSTGFDFVTPAGLSGHQARFSYSSATTFGGGVGLTIEYPVYRMLGIRAVASEWYFSGAPLEGDRARTLLGAGLSLRVW